MTPSEIAVIGAVVVGGAVVSQLLERRKAASSSYAISANALLAANGMEAASVQQGILGGGSIAGLTAAWGNPQSSSLSESPSDVNSGDAESLGEYTPGPLAMLLASLPYATFN